MTTLSLVRPGSYHDSVVLLSLARDLRGMPGVIEAAALMATPANLELLARAGLLAGEARAARPADLVIAIRAGTEAEAEAARARAELRLSARPQSLEPSGRTPPRTLESAHRRLPGASLALISVPGPFAALEARRALRRGLHVMLFSDNVPVEAEVELKQLACRRRLLLMGPDCGTAYLAGVPLGFANAVSRGRVGVVAASGTGLQQVASLLAAAGEGISHAIGVGGRDMTAEVGGLMTLAAIDALAGDPETAVLVVVGKPPAPEVRDAVEARLRQCGRPAVACLIGPGAPDTRDGSLARVSTLEDAATATLAALRGARWKPRPFTGSRAAVRRRVETARRGLAPGQRAVRGLYAGGTLAEEARLILAGVSGPSAAAGGADRAAPHRIADLGAGNYTAGRAHPMLDPTVRIAEIARAADDPSTAAILLDVVLGHGAAPDPAGDLAPAIERARAAARAAGREIAVVASVIGTAGDPQGLGSQIARLERAGAWVLPSNAQAARAAAAIAVGDPALAPPAPRTRR